MEQYKSGIQLLKISIESSHFEKAGVSVIDKDALEMEINKAYRIDNEDIFVQLAVKLIHKKNDKFVMGVIAEGAFQKKTPVQMNMNEFCEINAPAIIYPYIRQHIRSLSLDAGLTPIILPVINFVRAYSQGDKSGNE